MDVDLADRGASHFRLDAVQVQGAVLTSTHRHSVVGHLLARRRPQWNTIFTFAVAVISLLLFGANMHFFFTHELKVIVPEGGNITDASVTCYVRDQFVTFFVESGALPFETDGAPVHDGRLWYCPDRLPDLASYHYVSSLFAVACPDVKPPVSFIIDLVRSVSYVSSLLRDSCMELAMISSFCSRCYSFYPGAGSLCRSSSRRCTGRTSS